MEHLLRPPDRIALPEQRAGPGHQRARIVELGAEDLDDRLRPVGRPAVHHGHLIHEPRVEEIEERDERPLYRLGLVQRRHADRDRRAAAREVGARELAAVEGPPSDPVCVMDAHGLGRGCQRDLLRPPRTMARRGPGRNVAPLGGGSRSGSRRGARRNLARTPAGRAGRADPRRPPSRPDGGARGRRHRGALGPSVGRPRGRSPRPRDRDHGNGERQVAGLQPARAGHARHRPRRARLLPVPHQGARSGPGPRAGPDRRALPAPRDLRRGHAARGAAPDPAALEPDPHEPRHAPRGRPAQPPLLGRRAGKPCVGRGRRGPRVSRRLRVTRGKRAAAPAPARARVRVRAALHAHERHHREPARARRAADRARAGARRPRRRAAGRASDRDVEPAARGRAARQARLRALRGGQPARGARRTRGADDLLPQVAPRRGADPALRAGAPRGRREGRPRRADRPLPGRLHAAPAPRDRAAAERGRPARRGRHRRARARHRRRGSRRRNLRDLPRHCGEPAPDVGTRRAARHRARHVHRGRGRA